MRRIFRLPGTKRRVDEDLEQELRFHLEGRIEDLMEREGLSHAAAEREATRRFGDYDEYRREVREIDNAILRRRNRVDLIEAIRRETRHAVRSLSRAPAFSVITILTLALGLGAATTIFTLLDHVVLRPLPYPNAERLIHIGTMWPKIKAGEEYGISRGQYFFLRKNSNSLADLLLFDADVLAIPGDGEHPAERVVEIDASASTFAILGIHPELGRLFTTADELSPDGDPRVALISHGYWQRRFGADPNIVGKRLPIGGDKSIEIIGVLPATAAVPEVKGDVWIRNHLDPADKPVNNHTHHAIGLLKPGVSIAAAAADLRRVQTAMTAAYPDVYSQGFINAVGFAINVSSLRDAVVGPTVVRALWLLFGAVAFVLLIAGANVANLFLVRIDAHRGEVAVRTALGADRAHLALHYLTESMLVAAIAGAGAIALGTTLLHVVLAIAPQSLPRLDEVGFGWRSVAFCMSAALAFGLVMGVLPLGSIDVDVAVLREGGRGLTSSRSRDLVRRTLVLSQVALAVLLLAGGGLMAKSFARLRDVKPGFDPNGVVTMTVSLPYTRYPKSAQITGFWRELLPRIEAVPGVVHAGASGDLPLLDAGGCSYVITDATGVERGNCMPMTVVTPGYFEAMGIRVRGTLPTWSSVEAGVGPTIVTAAFAKRFWQSESVINRTVRPFNPRNPAFTVVGVADDIRANGLENPPIEEAYFAAVAPVGMPQWGPDRAMHLVVRAPTLSASAVVAAVRKIVANVDPQVPLSDIAPMEIVVAKSMGQTSFVMLLLVIAAAISLMLSAVGIYGVISYVVGQRRGEIGIRIALGAQASEVARMMVGRSLALSGAGVVVGVAGALAGTRLLRSLLFEVSPTDPLVLGGAAAALFIVAAFASAGPVRRAARIDPVEAMRTG
jgi:predicted permease